MGGLKRDKRLFRILAANILSSIGSGITMTAIPWLLVNRTGGEETFGYITIGMTVLMLILAPYIGVLVDFASRKKILLAGELMGFVIIAGFAMIGILGGAYSTWHFLILFGTGSLYYALFYPTMFAFNQEVFDKSQYQALNGIMEVQGQLSAVLAGALASLVVGKIDFGYILAFDGLTYLGAFLFIMKIPYVQTQTASNKESFWKKLGEGFHYMKQQPALFFFFAAAFMPFIGVMATNYIFPIYVKDVLSADAEVFSLQGMFYGIGAVAAGLMAPLMLRKFGNEKSIVITVFIYTLGMVLHIFFPVISIFYFLAMLLAFGNAGTRVARNTLMMELVPNEKIGRVNSLFKIMELSCRIALLTAFTKVVAAGDVIIPFEILSVLMIAALIIVFIIMKSRSGRKEMNNVSSVM